jgi:aryl-alcohol dehydrogenase-like predicted oxidoreductase
VNKRKIGKLDVSAVGLGCNNFGGRVDEAATRAVVDAALEAGITLLDTADIYGGTRSEEFLGRILSGRRDSVVLATKFGMKVDDEHPGGADPAYVRAAVADSLRRLRTDRIDLYQLHQPDPSTPIQDTLEVLNELVQEGKVRQIGCSNFSAAQLREAQAAVAPGAPAFVSVQNQLSLLNRGDFDDGLAEAGRLHLAYIPFFPLMSGLLSGKYRRGQAPPPGTRIGGMPPERAGQFLSEANFDRIESLARFAEERGHTLLELAFGWLLAQPPVACVIAGATSPEQLRSNVAAGLWKMDAEELAALDRVLRSSDKR